MLSRQCNRIQGDHPKKCYWICLCSRQSGLLSRESLHRHAWLLG